MNIFKRIGKGLQRIFRSPAGKVIAVAAAAYIGAPAVRSAVESMSNGGSISDAMSAFGGSAMDQMGKIGSGVSSMFGGGGEMQASTDGSGYGFSEDPAKKPLYGPQQSLVAGEKEAAKSLPGWFKGGPGLMDKTLSFLSTPGGGAVASAALKLAAGAMTPNDVAMRINAEDQWKKEEEARRLRNTGVGGVNINIPITSPHARLPVPPSAVKVPGSA